MSDHETYEVLLMKAVDGVITKTEQSELDTHMQGCSSCAAELADFRTIKETTDALTQRISRDAALQPVEAGAEKVFGTLSLVLMLVGALLLFGVGGYVFFFDPAVHPLVKLGAALCSVGAFGLLAYSLNLARRAHGDNDPYKEIDR